MLLPSIRRNSARLQRGKGGEGVRFVVRRHDARESHQRAETRGPTSTSTTTLLVDRSQFRWPVFVTGSLPRVTYLERTASPMHRNERAFCRFEDSLILASSDAQDCSPRHLASSGFPGQETTGKSERETRFLLSAGKFVNGNRSGRPRAW